MLLAVVSPRDSYGFPVFYENLIWSISSVYTPCIALHSVALRLPCMVYICHLPFSQLELSRGRTSPSRMSLLLVRYLDDHFFHFQPSACAFYVVLSVGIPIRMLNGVKG